MITLHNVPKFHTNRSLRSLLYMQSVNIKHIRIRRDLDQFFSFPNSQENEVKVLTRSCRYRFNNE